jgi:hypothetical protein
VANSWRALYMSRTQRARVGPSCFPHLNVFLLHIWIASTVWLMGFSWADGDHDLMMMMVIPDSAGDAS